MSSLNFLTIGLIIITIINCKINDGARILGIFPLQGSSHFVMCERLMKLLAKNGHQVDVISHFPLKEPFPNYKDFSLNGTLHPIVNNVNYSDIHLFSTKSLKNLLLYAGDKVCELLKHPILENFIKNPPNHPPYDLVIIEIFAAPCYFAFSRHLKIPIIGITTSSIYDWINEPLGNPTNLAFVPCLFSSLPSKMNFWQRLMNVVLFNLVKYQFNYYADKQKRYIDESFGVGYPSIYELSTEFDLVFINSHYSLNGVKPMTPAIVEELQQWLDESNHGCIYMSFGSMVKIESFPKEILKIFYTTFENIAPVRILMKIANKMELPPRLPNNVKTYHWLPQIQVLKHKNVKAFVTHGGLMGTLESIYAAVPMVGFPLFNDQIQNIKKYEEMKIAIFLEHECVTSKKFTYALNMILKNPKYRKNIKKLSKFYFDRLMNPQDTVIFWVEYILRNGNILRSRATDINFYQVELFDIYAFIAILILLFIYLAYLIIKFIIKMII
ncbi:UDP-glucosyltransferase 2-like isoform X2 [Leptopilina boulardi]|uniref:UDP-glucosyltransferase 2-like isoform X2 n=1 Tax=Leptopilina boulardi TaxID=63433 RepID=UPI0021F58E4F|nr:UDP-glucosyltransferase 2-like isoform X2 [Leptopilina boulardi]